MVRDCAIVFIAYCCVVTGNMCCQQDQQEGNWTLF